MAAPTALQLVNRVNRKRRQGDVTALDGQQEKATLDAINEAMSDVLTGNSWEFDVRHDQIRTRPRNVGGSFTHSSGTAVINVFGFTTKTLEADDIYGDFILRAVPTGDADYANTALRVLSSVLTSPGVAGFTIASQLDGLAASGSCELFYSEYVLPDTVRTVHRMTHQERELTLDQLGATVEFDELYPRPYVEYGEPRVASVGGFDISTYEAAGTAPDPRLRMVIWPVPDEEYVLDYKYSVRHVALEDATDTLDGVPDEVVDQIVELATADMIAFYEQRVDDARALRRDTMESMDKIHARHGGQATDRKVIRGWDSVLNRDYRGIIGGRLIGGG